jgi:hypothetical protein
MHWISIVRSLYFIIFSASFWIIFYSPEIALCINRSVSFSLSRIVMSGLLLGMVLSVWTFRLKNMATLPSWLVATNFGTRSYQCSFSNYTPISSHMLKGTWSHTPSRCRKHCSLPILGMLMYRAYCHANTVGIRYLVLFEIFLLLDPWFVTPHPVLLLFQFQFLLSDLPSIAIGMHLLHQ